MSGEGSVVLKTGMKAPDFLLEAVGRKKLALSDFTGKWLVLFIYPKDGTKG